MGTIIGVFLGIVLFAVIGFLPAFRFGSYLALFILNKITGRPVEPTFAVRTVVIAGALLSILSGAVFFLIIGGLIGSLV